MAWRLSYRFGRTQIRRATRSVRGWFTDTRQWTCSYALACPLVSCYQKPDISPLEVLGKDRSYAVDWRVVIPLVNPRREPCISCLDGQFIENDPPNQ